MNTEIIKKRISALAGVLKETEVDGMIVTSMSNVTYLTGFMGHDSWALVLGKKVWLITDSRYTEQAASECSGCKIVQRNRGLAEEAAKILKRFKSKERLAVEDTLSLAAFANIKKHIKLKFKKTSRLIEQIRAIKSPDEVANIRKASKIADDSLAAALSELKVGMSESELAGLMDFEMRKRSSYAAFDTIVCFGPNGSRNHHFPGKRKLRKNDTVLIDFGACYKGYRSDKTRTFGVGKVSRDFAEAYETVIRAQAAAIEKIAPGIALKDIDTAAREVIEKTKFPAFEHGTGHGLGLDVHEFPNMSRLSKGSLMAGQVVTVEPGIYIPGKFGIRIEDDVLVTDNGYKILTRTKQSPQLEMLKISK